MIQQSSLPRERACQALNVSRSAYYKWQGHESIIRDDEKVRAEIQKIASKFSKYGYRRITKELHRRGMQVNHKRVLRIMKEENILCRMKRFKPQTTESDHDLKVYPNLAKDADVTGINQLWVSDITYVRLRNSFVYLAVINDVYTRKCIGWALERSMTVELTLNALNMAITARKAFGLSGLIHHSDQGVQYAANEYVTVLNENGIKISMSRKGNPYDNAFAESFIKTIKAEEVYINEYETFEEAYENIKDFIEKVYNAKRLHSSIGYVPPNEFEQEVLNRSVS